MPRHARPGTARPTTPGRSPRRPRGPRRGPRGTRRPRAGRGTGGPPGGPSRDRTGHRRGARGSPRARSRTGRRPRTHGGPLLCRTDPLDIPEQSGADASSALVGVHVDLDRGQVRVVLQGHVELGDAEVVTGAKSEEHTSELQSLMCNSYAVFCLKKKKNHTEKNTEKKNNIKCAHKKYIQNT